MYHGQVVTFQKQKRIIESCTFTPVFFQYIFHNSHDKQEWWERTSLSWSWPQGKSSQISPLKIFAVGLSYIRLSWCWAMFPLSLHGGEFLSRKDDIFCQMLFLYLLRGSYGFYSSFINVMYCTDLRTYMQLSIIYCK